MNANEIGARAHAINHKSKVSQELIEQMQQEDYNEYFLQDRRSYAGDYMFFWALDRKGYTTDINKAHIFTKDEAVGQYKCRDGGDLPWRCDFIRSKIRHCVSIEDCINR